MDRRSAGSWIAVVAMALVLALAAACSHPTDDAASSESALAENGPWKLPSEVLAQGAKVRIAYEDAPKWTGTGTCAGKLKPGGHALGEYLVDRFAVVTSVGGYACRRNTADASRMSVHGTGRALDVFIPRIGGSADNGRGDKVANWLVMNAQRIGVQLVIWDRSIWRANGTNAGAYGGPHPHDDHIHVELTNAAAAKSTAWFADDTSDAGTTTDDGDDASTTTDAASASSDAGSSADAAHDSGVITPADAGKKDAAPGDPSQDDHADDAGTTAADSGAGKDPPAETNPDPSAGESSAADAPGDTSSLGGSPPKNRKATASAEDEPIPTGGCTAAPTNNLAGTSAVSLLAFALALITWSRRRRR